MKDDDTRFQNLYRSHFRPVFLFFRKQQFSEEESQDLTQEVFLRVYTHMKTFRQEAKLETYLFQVMQSVWKNAVRALSAKKRKAPVISIDRLPEGAADPPDTAAPADRKAMMRERRQILNQAIEKLPPKMRQCVLMYYVQGRKVREISQVLGISTGTVKFHLLKARERLSESLGDVSYLIHFSVEENP